MGWIARLRRGKVGRWLRACLGAEHNVDELARRIGLSAQALRAFQPQYREVFVAKRAGGQRRLLVPDQPTKGLQRVLLRRVFGKLRAHPAACGFERGRSIVHNALPHAGQSVVIRMDVIDFFPTTGADRLEAYFRHIGWNAEAAALLVQLTTHEGGLPQGAPTSPRLSNLVNYLLDVQLSRVARKRRGQYTRYADDITFSFPKDYPRQMRGVVQRACQILNGKGYSAHQHKKLSIRRRHQRQVVTGLVVNAKPQLSRALRRKLRAALHHQRTGRPATFSAAQLAGWQALQTMIRSQTENGK